MTISCNEILGSTQDKHLTTHRKMEKAYTNFLSWARLQRCVNSVKIHQYVYLQFFSFLSTTTKIINVCVLQQMLT